MKLCFKESLFTVKILRNHRCVQKIRKSTDLSESLPIYSFIFIAAEVITNADHKYSVLNVRINNQMSTRNRFI